MSIFAETLPWFWPLVSRIVAVLIVWLLLCFPAYLVLPYVRLFREGLRSVLATLTERVAEIRLERRNVRAQLLQSILLDYAGRTAVETGHQRWRAAIADLIEPVHVLSARSETVLTHLMKITRSSKAALPDPLAPMAPVEDLKREFADERLAWLNLAFSSLVLLASMAVNVAMLSQILRDLELIPEDLRFVSLPLTSVFAALLTVVEAGIGFLHAAAREHAGRDDRTLSIGSVATLAAAAIIAFVEGFFYSRQDQCQQYLTCHSL